MKTLITQALNDAIVLLEKQIPQIKRQVIETDSIMDISPLGLVKFMRDNNIPDSAYFGGIDNGDDGYSDFCLCYDIEVPTTDNDKLKYRKGRFNSIAFKKVYDLLLINGYKRVGFMSGRLKEFDDTTIYDMFITNDFDRLVKYYSLSFAKI